MRLDGPCHMRLRKQFVLHDACSSWHRRTLKVFPFFVTGLMLQALMVFFNDYLTTAGWPFPSFAWPLYVVQDRSLQESFHVPCNHYCLQFN